MSTELAIAGESEGGLAHLDDQVQEYVKQSKAASTLRAYRNDWAHFTAWCEAHGVASLPAAPETVAAYLAAFAQQNRTTTLGRRLVAIRQAHVTSGHNDPTKNPGVRATWQGIRRCHGVAPKGKAPAVVAEIRRMVAVLPSGLLGVRDRALLLTGFGGALRRSELVALDCPDVAVTSAGLVVTVRRSKADQEGEGRKLGIPYGSNPDTCPVRSLQAWLDAASISIGPLFRPVNRHGQVGDERLSDRAVALVVKRYAAAAGLDPANYAGHSLRAGLATSAAAAGASERAIMAQTGHRSVVMVRRYIRDGSLFRENAAAVVGL